MPGLYIVHTSTSSELLYACIHFQNVGFRAKYKNSEHQAWFFFCLIPFQYDIIERHPTLSFQNCNSFSCSFVGSKAMPYLGSTFGGKLTFFRQISNLTQFYLEHPKLVMLKINNINIEVYFRKQTYNRYYSYEKGLCKNNMFPCFYEPCVSITTNMKYCYLLKASNDECVMAPTLLQYMR